MANKGSNRRFGITSTLDGLSQGIVINSISHSDSTETAEARDEKGQIIDLAVYGGGDEVTIDGLVTGEGVKAGTTIKLGDKWYLVTTTSKNETNTAFQTASVNARYAPNCEYWPLSAVISGTYDQDGYLSGTINSDSGPVGE